MSELLVFGYFIVGALVAGAFFNHIGGADSESSWMTPFVVIAWPAAIVFWLGTEIGGRR